MCMYTCSCVCACVRVWTFQNCGLWLMKPLGLSLTANQSLWHLNRGAGWSFFKTQPAHLAHSNNRSNHSVAGPELPTFGCQTPAPTAAFAHLLVCSRRSLFYPARPVKGGAAVFSKANTNLAWRLQHALYSAAASWHGEKKSLSWSQISRIQVCVLWVIVKNTERYVHVYVFELMKVTISLFTQINLSGSGKGGRCDHDKSTLEILFHMAAWEQKYTFFFISSSQII